MGKNKALLKKKIATLPSEASFPEKMGHISIFKIAKT